MFTRVDLKSSVLFMANILAVVKLSPPMPRALYTTGLRDGEHIQFTNIDVTAIKQHSSGKVNRATG